MPGRPTRTRINFQPCERRVLGQLELLGNTRNQTRATTPQAAIDSTGDAQFLMTKALEFNGRQVATHSPAAFLVTSQRSRGSDAALRSPAPGAAGGHYAASVANQQRPESERIAAYKITEQVVPQFNTAVDEQLTRLNSQLGTLFAWLASQRLEPASLITRSTEQGMIVQCPGHERGSRDSFGRGSSERGLSIVLHENLIRGALPSAAAGGCRSGYPAQGGAETSSRTLLGGAPPAADPAVPLGVATFVLVARGTGGGPVSEWPRGGLRRDVGAGGGSGTTESEAITLRIRIDVEADSLRVTPEPVDVRTLEPGERRWTMWRIPSSAKSIESQFQPAVQRPAAIHDPARRRARSCRSRLLAGASPRDGWLVIRLMTETPPARDAVRIRDPRQWASRDGASRECPAQDVAEPARWNLRRSPTSEPGARIDDRVLGRSGDDGSAGGRGTLAATPLSSNESAFARCGR